MPPTTGYSFGDVVLVPFPFTDQAGIKKRPAVIISSAAYNTVQRDLFYQKNAGGTLDPVTNYSARFGVIDFLTTTSPTQQFVGSYRMDVFAVDQGKSLMFVLNNTSSFKSFAYGAPPAPAYERSTFGPAGNMRQTYWWTEPRR